MSLTNYRRGADKERRIVNLFRNKGWIAARSAGSHSPIDIFAIDYNNKKIKLIQSKLGTKICGEKRKEVLDWIDKIKGTYEVNMELWE